MIKSHTVYNLFCDGCGRWYNQSSNSEFGLINDAIKLNGWEEHFHLIYCDQCIGGKT
jgi:hypothetical protein